MAARRRADQCRPAVAIGMIDVRAGRQQLADPLLIATQGGHYEIVHRQIPFDRQSAENATWPADRPGVETPPLTKSSSSVPASFVISMNLHRRHPNESQRAMIAAKLATLKSGQHAGSVPPKEGQQNYRPSLSAGEAAELLNVGKKTVSDAKKVLTDGTPADIAAVESGTSSIPST
jgi:hypothetical protein